MPRIMNRANLRALARLGAMRRLEEIRQEEASIRAAFPDLVRRGRPGRRAAGAHEGAASGRRRRRRRWKMSAAQKKAVSDRMRKYWAERRKSKG